jgi:hypothetical protein
MDLCYYGGCCDFLSYRHVDTQEVGIMRTGASQNQGQRIAQLFTDAIEANGELLYVMAGPSHPGRQPKSQAPLFAICEAPRAEDIQAIQLEGAYNLKDSSPFVFTFPNGSDVQANDTFVFQGFTRRIVTAYPQPLNGAILGIRCVAIRVGEGTPGVAQATSGATPAPPPCMTGGEFMTGQEQDDDA